MSLHGNPAERGHSHKFLTGSFTPGGLSESTRHGPDTTPIERLSIKSTFLSKHVIGKSFMSHNGADGKTKNMKLSYFSWPTGFTDAKKPTNR